MADSRWMQGVENTLGRFAARNHARPTRALLLGLAFTFIGLYCARNLSLNADLIDLLPKSFRSVQDVEKLKDRFGGIGYVVVVGQGADDKQLQEFADDIAPKLAKIPAIRFVEHRRSSRFFEDHGLYYLEKADLELIKQRIEDRVAWERGKRNPLFIDLEEEAEPPSIDFSDIEAKYGGSGSRRLAGDGQDFYLDSQERMVVLLCKPSGNAADLNFSAKLITDVEAFLKTQDLSRWGPNFRVSLTGTFKKKIDQQAQIKNDLGVASSLALILLLVYLGFHFRSILAVLLSLLPVLAGLTWTYGFVGIAYGQVNLLTGFLGAILGGLGTEHGIHLLGRYAALRNVGVDSEKATQDAFTHTGGSALISSLVAALTFLSLAISEFRAFREFGVIAAVGMIVSIVAYVIILPALLGLVSRFGWNLKEANAVTGHDTELGRYLPRYAKQTAWVMAVALGILFLNMPHARFNYDFAALEDAGLPSYVLDFKTNKILGYSQTPVVVLTQAAQTEAEVVKELRKRKAELGSESTVDFVAAMEDLVPPDQFEKQKTLKELHEILGRIDSKSLDTPAKQALDRALRMVQTPPFTREDLPEGIRRQFQGVGKSETGFVLVFPSISLADGTKVRKFAKEVRQIKLASGEVLSAAGEAMVLADILEMVARESPPVLIAAVVSVLIAMWLTLGSLRTALICMVPTVVSILALVGLMPIVDMQFNYINIIMIPVLIGTTVDAGVHLVSRLTEGGHDFAAVFGETGRAICGGLLTSAVGFGALLLAAHPGLNSVGKLANLGFATNLVCMLLGFPALLLVLEKRRASRGASKT